jgi:hypothetical protein
MTKYNWKYLKKGKGVIFALCIGDKLVREVMSQESAAMFEALHPDDEFENHIKDFMEKQLRIFYAKRNNKYIEEVLTDEGYTKFINRQKKPYEYGSEKQLEIKS